ncbi:DUF4178 domain-containing protein [Corynebacterium uterequi]|uniref:Putative DUF4178 family protein n=1 Tax=Corynebacterium uterequi TaxID=1072256 RepID=A0A0G3HEE8_9CORY|nr:DUF4178 domain-containing protein [Corynebacterium uterequi]AKK11701.1 putative DUF4178 family protein [Corynebacterium uterequi]
MSTLTVIIGIALVLVAVALFYLANTSKDRQPSPAATPQRFGDDFDEVDGAAAFSPARFGPGSIVSYGATDYIVRETLSYSQGPYRWYEHRLDGGNGASWLSTEVDEGEFTLVWWTTRKALRVTPAATVEVDGVTYHEEERGHAQYTRQTTEGIAESGVVRFIDFEDASGENFLGLESFGERDDDTSAAWEVSTGRRILPGELTVYAKPGAE